MVNKNSTLTPKKERKIKADIKLVFRAILALVISIVLGVSVYTVNAKLVLGDDMPMPLGVGIGVIMSGSMEPELSVDDVIFVVRDKGYSVGDTVVFQSHGMLIVHKIVSIDGDTVITQGTANNVADDPINADAIKGKVIGHIDAEQGRPFIAFVDLIRSPFAAVLILGIAAVLLVMSYKSDKREKFEKNAADIERIRAEIMALKANTKDNDDLTQ